jgi:hypothetical protein
MMRTTSAKLLGAITAAIGGAVLVVAPLSRADTIPLNTAGATYTDAQGALYYQINGQPTGTGVIGSFVRIQQTGSEEGFNTDTNNQLQNKDGTWTHSLALSALNTSTINGVDYYGFFLDINQENNSPLLSLNKLQVYTTDDPNIKDHHETSASVGSTTDGFNSAADPVYDVDGAGDKTVELDYSLGAGSGQGDMLVYIQKSLFAGKTGQYVVLFSSFGNPNASNDGFEEWWTAPSVNLGPGTPPPVAAPLPSTALAGIGIFSLLGLNQLRRPRRA